MDFKLSECRQTGTFSVGFGCSAGESLIVTPAFTDTQTDRQTKKDTHKQTDRQTDTHPLTNIHSNSKATTTDISTHTDRSEQIYNQEEGYDVTMSNSGNSILTIIKQEYNFEFNALS